MSRRYIDVIIPTYNGLPWLKPAIESVLSQTHTDFKLYVVDDGSTDKTKDYIQSIKDKRIVYIRKPNGGQSSARNLGIRSSESEFLAFLDSDDVWMPNKLEDQLKVMLANNSVGLVYGHHYIIDEDDVVQRNLRLWSRGDIANELSGGNIIAGSASMVLLRRSMLEHAGVFREDFVNGEDWELWLRIALISKVDFVPKILASIRVHPNSHQVNTKKMADGLVYAYGVMKQELNLSKLQRCRVATYCLHNAADMYLAIGDRWQAKKIIWQLFKEDRKSFFSSQNWKAHISWGLFSRVIMGNPIYDYVKHNVGRSRRLCKRILFKCFRLGKTALHFLLRKIKLLFL